MTRFFVIALSIWFLHAGPASAQSEQNAPEEAQGTSPAKWSFGVNGGYAHRLFRVGFISIAEEEAYIRDLKSGVSFGGRANYYPWKKVGFGVRYEMYRGSATYSDGFQEDVSIQHASGMVTYRSFLNNPKTAVLTSFLLGYQPYQNKTNFNGTDYTLNGKSMGWGVSVGVERRLGEKLYVDLTATAMMGALYRVTRSTAYSTSELHLSMDNQIDLSRVSLTLGIGLIK
jgi:hypothetical protein